MPTNSIWIRPYNFYGPCERTAPSGSLGEALKLPWTLHGGRRASMLACTQATARHLIAQNNYSYVTFI